jgi:carboxyl-terminal processing protease
MAAPLDERQALAAVKARIQSDFVRRVGDAELTQPTPHAMAAALDPPGEYFTEAESALYREGLSPQLTGIESTLTSSAGRTTLVPGIDGPADLAGLLPDDVLLSVDGQPVAGLTLQQTRALLRGKPGSKVRLTVARGTEPPRPVELTRRASPLPTVRAARADADTLVLGVSRFENKTLQELAEALGSEWKSRPYKGVVLDLRRCTGGLMTTTVGLAAVFLPAATVVGRAEGQAERANQTFRAERGDYVSRFLPDPFVGLPPAVRQVPLVVLTDEFTGAGAEFVAAALQDSRRGVVVGRRTAGKGIVRTYFPLQGGAALLLPTARWVTPAGAAIEGTGVQPEHVLPRRASGQELAAAVELLHRLPAQRP